MFREKILKFLAFLLILVLQFSYANSFYKSDNDKKETIKNTLVMVYKIDTKKFDKIINKLDYVKLKKVKSKIDKIKSNPKYKKYNVKLRLLIDYLDIIIGDKISEKLLLQKSLNSRDINLLKLEKIKAEKNYKIFSIEELEKYKLTRTQQIQNLTNKKNKTKLDLFLLEKYKQELKVISEIQNQKIKEKVAKQIKELQRKKLLENQKNNYFSEEKNLRKTEKKYYGYMTDFIKKLINSGAKITKLDITKYNDIFVIDSDYGFTNSLEFYIDNKNQNIGYITWGKGVCLDSISEKEFRIYKNFYKKYSDLKIINIDDNSCNFILNFGKTKKYYKINLRQKTQETIYVNDNFEFIKYGKKYKVVMKNGFIKGKNPDKFYVDSNIKNFNKFINEVLLINGNNFYISKNGYYFELVK